MTILQARLSLLLLLAIANTPKVGSQRVKVSARDVRMPLGIWESNDGEGGAVGINLWEDPSSAGHGGPLPPGDDGFRPVLQIGIYQRKNMKVRCGEENFYDTGWRGAKFGMTTDYTYGSLAVHNPAKLGGDISLDLELKRDSAQDVWFGRFHRGSFDRNLVLHRVGERPSHDQEICTTPGLMPRSTFP